MSRDKTAAIVANGDDDRLEEMAPALSAMDMVIAADGGADACLGIGVFPTLIIGDLDSVSPAARSRFEAAGVPFLQHPADKDQTDLELALDAALKRGATRITIYCAMGGRWDMTAATLFLLMSPALKDIDTIVTDGRQHMRLIRGGETLTLPGRPGDTLSLLPLGVPARGVTATGVDWPLSNATLYPWQTRGVSNRFADGAADITVGDGTLLCVHSETAEH